MFKKFSEIEEYILKQGFKAKVALAGSNDIDTLSSIVYAKKKGIIEAILIGDEFATKELLKTMNEPEEDYTFVHEENVKKCAEIAVELVNSGKADMPMKGLIPTALFLKAILNKEKGFVPEKGLISVANAYESEVHGKFIVFADCAININPDYNAKKQILENAVKLSHQLGVENPKVAVVAPVEVINPVMQSTIDAAMLSKACDRDQIKGCMVDGPLGMDNAISKEAAKHKGIKSEVAGDPDVVIFPDLASANMFTKGIVYLGNGSPSSGVATGTTIGVIMTSRSDTPINKYNSILIGVLQTFRKDY